MEFGKFVNEITKDRTDEAGPKVLEAKADTYKISCVCTGVSFSDSCMTLGPFHDSCMALGKSCLAVGKN
jgi:hypothetical protein